MYGTSTGTYYVVVREGKIYKIFYFFIFLFFYFLFLNAIMELKKERTWTVPHQYDNMTKLPLK